MAASVTAVEVGVRMEIMGVEMVVLGMVEVGKVEGGMGTVGVGMVELQVVGMVDLEMVGVGIGNLEVVRVQMMVVGLALAMVVVQLVLEPLLMVLARGAAVAAEMMVLGPLRMALVRLLVVAALRAMEKRLVQVLHQKVTPLMLLVQLVLLPAHLLRAAGLVTVLVLLQMGAVLVMLQAATLIVNLQAVTLLLTAQQEQMPVPHLRGQVLVQLSVMGRGPGSSVTPCQKIQGQPE